MHTQPFDLTSPDGTTLRGRRWVADGEAPARAVVVIAHGMAEHGDRYARFAEALTGAGFAVYAADHRGHGRTAEGGTLGYFAESDGWNRVADDIDTVVTHASAEHPGAPIVLFGHSMGSFATQQYLLDHSADVDAVVLSGTTDPGPLSQTLDSDEPSDLSAFNAPFEHRTGYEWLSRDEAEVDKYVADPACGWEAPPFKNIATLQRASDALEVEKIRKNVPILLVSGDTDPLAGGGAAIEAVAQRYKDAGIEDVTVTLYPEGRHELLNETNRDEVTAHILAFLDRTVG